MPTWYEEESAYEDWIVRREELAKTYYGDEDQSPHTIILDRNDIRRKQDNKTTGSNKKTEQNSRNVVVGKKKEKQQNFNRTGLKTKELKKDETDVIDFKVRCPSSSDTEEISMWSCRKCTLDNPLIEKVCEACGGSRLASIGDIDIPRMFKCEVVQNLIQGTLREKGKNLYNAYKRLSKIDDYEDKEDSDVKSPNENLDLGYFSHKNLILFIIYILTFIIVYNY